MCFCRVAAFDLRLVLVAVVLATASGCRAGHPRPRTADVPPESPRLEAFSGNELAERLSLTDAGKVLQKALDAHGGWDRWVASESIQYRRLRTPASKQSPESVAAPPDSSGAATISPATAASEPGTAAVMASEEGQNTSFEWSPADLGPLQDDEGWIFLLPFVLAHPRYTHEYLGVEWELGAEREVQKVKLVNTESAWGPAMALTACFDRNSGLLDRILGQRVDGSWFVVRFSGWQTVGDLRIPTLRKWYDSKGQFRRVRDEDLLWTDKLVDITTQ